MKNQQGNFGPILPIADTVSGMQARENPQGTVHHYQSLQTQLWLSPKVRDVADGMLSHVQQGRTAWGSLSGPYGFGKTAAAISLWTHARNEGFLAIPPLSCTNFDELAYGIVALAGVQAPKMKRQIQTCFWEVWTEGLDHAVQTDAKRYDVSARKVRQIFQDKLRSGQFTLDSHPYRLVEFLAKLGQLATEFSNGLIIILDEIQQLLGPLDARAIVRFREFVWGMRTERSHCGVILALDSLLEARLSRWAADVLHRIRENGPTLQLTDVYTREFPFWLWERLTNTHEKDKRCLPRAALTEEVLVSLDERSIHRFDLPPGHASILLDRTALSSKVSTCILQGAIITDILHTPFMFALFLICAQMAVKSILSLEEKTMPPYRSQVLGHPGLVAHIFDELGMAISSTRQHNDASISC